MKYSSKKRGNGENERKRQHEYRMTELFCSFCGANGKTQTTSTPVMPGQFSTNTHEPARPSLPPNQKPISKACMLKFKTLILLTLCDL